MLNDVTLIGIVSNDLILKKVNNKDCLDVVLSVKRDFRDKELNKYIFDKIKFSLWKKLARKTQYYCRVGSIIAIQGNIIIRNNGTETINKIMVEKITFLGMRK